MHSSGVVARSFVLLLLLTLFSNFFNVMIVIVIIWRSFQIGKAV